MSGLNNKNHMNGNLLFSKVLEQSTSAVGPARKRSLIVSGSNSSEERISVFIHRTLVN